LWSDLAQSRMHMYVNDLVDPILGQWQFTMENSETNILICLSNV
jgi:hypothetical protein